MKPVVTETSTPFAACPHERRFGPSPIPEYWEAEGREQLDRLVKRITQPRENTMHYRNGREAKNGDKIIQLGMDGSQITAVGVLYNATPGNDYCNGNIAPIQSVPTGACMCDCLHLDDVAAMLKEKGLDKRPAGK